MLTTTELQYSVPRMVSPPLDDHLELSRLLAAAVVNPSFCHLLLVDPQQAIENGYQGETFLLSDVERYLLLFIHAGTLADLARQIAQSLEMSLPVPSPSYARVPDLIGFGY
jgi:hypothetical protein